MPSVFSRLAPYATPQWLLILLGSLVAYRVLRRLVLARLASSALNRARAAKSLRRTSELQVAEAKMAETQGQRRTQERNIVAMSATQLVQKMSKGELSARLVLHCMLSRLLAAQNEFNVLSESNFQQALDAAEKADAVLKSSGRPIGSLHGLPISVKDSVRIAGLDTTLGLVRYSAQPASDDALIVKLLKAQGASIHCKTNIPQTLLSFECSNPLHGRTLNPYNKNLTCGGSSGGESALLACRGSVLGIGTDIGGSVRIPAHFCGNTALKPTARRVSLQGFRPSVPGQEAIPAVAGPMASCVEDLTLMLRELWVQAAWDADHDLVPLSFNSEEFRRDSKLNVGYYVDDGFLEASPACARAVMTAVEALRKDGHRVTEFRPPLIADVIAIYYALITSDRAQTISRQLEGEVWEDYCKTLITGVRLPPKLKALVSWILKNVVKDEKAALITGATRERSVAELWSLQSARKQLRQQFFEEWKRAGDFDVVLCPVHVLPAVPHHTFKKISFTCSYTLVYNVLDLPAGVLPVTTVDREKDAYTYPARGILAKTARSCYNLEEQHGTPLGVQVVGQPFKDETVLRAMRIIERLVDFKPRTPI